MSKSLPDNAKSKVFDRNLLCSRRDLQILKWTLLQRSTCIIALFASACLLRPFDTSSILILNLGSRKNALVNALAGSILRWDVVHFLGAASPRPLPVQHLSREVRYVMPNGGAALAYEQTLAFQPGILWLLRWAGGSQQAHWDPCAALIITSTITTLLSCAHPIILYRIGLPNSHVKAKDRRIGDRKRMSSSNNDRAVSIPANQLARIAALLSILSMSPATLLSPTPEAVFAFYTLLGHWIIAVGKDNGHVSYETLSAVSSSLCFAIASALRANGVALSGFILWQMIWSSARRQSLIVRLVAGVILAGLAAFPFVLYQVWAFNRFCKSDATFIRPKWCGDRFGLSYTSVQSQYWNVGPLRYWTPSQTPNWLLAAPVLFITGRWSVSYLNSQPREIIRQICRPFIRTHLSRSVCEDRQSTTTEEPMLPHVLYTIAVLSLLIISSHVQIVLRFASSGALPAFWWAISEKIVTWSAKERRNVVAAFVLWNFTSTILYAGFYPPA